MLFKNKEIEITHRQTMLTLPQFSHLIRQKPEFSALVAVVGQEAAEESIKDMHWTYTGKYKLKGAILEDGDWERTYSADFRKTLTRQREKAISTKALVQRLFRKALANELGSNLRQPQNILPMARYGATDKDIDSIKGAKWIVMASGSNKMSANDIADVIIECRCTDRSIFELGTLRFLHDRLVPKGSIGERRPLNIEQPWPSSGAAKALQKIVADNVRTIGARTRLLKAADWDSFACYFLAAYMRTHGFPDGNGRPNRALYVLAMLEGFRPFVAPTHSFEQSLCD